jgi:inhibitor of cysteine peptidase
MDNRVLVGIIAGIIIVGATAFYFISNTPQENPEPFSEPSTSEKFSTTKLPSSNLTSHGLIKFHSADEVKQYLVESQIKSGYGQGGIRTDGMMVRFDAVASEPAPAPRTAPGVFTETSDLQKRSLDSSSSDSYSTTNIQVANVDEPDYIKNDGKYIYIVHDKTLSIIDAYPPQDAKQILKIGFDIGYHSIENIFLDGDKLVLMYRGSGEKYQIPEFGFAPEPFYVSKTIATILDVTDRENPKIITKYEIDGDYNQARMIDGMVYILTTNWVDYHRPIIPLIMESTRIIAPDVYHFPNPEQSYVFNTVTAFDTSGVLKNSETFLMGPSNTVYVSEGNLFITYQKNIPYQFHDTLRKDRFFDVIVPLLPKNVQDQIRQIQSDPALDSATKWSMVSQLLEDTYNTLPKDEKEKLFSTIQKALDEYDTKTQSDYRRTVIHKIALDNGNLKYIANGEVPGYLLNQFSMDESNNKFRIATTTEVYTRERTLTSNNVYVLDDKLHLVGKLEKIAPDETIYSARFMGDRLYLVTFQRIDPFFVIDLSTNTPKILGALKIPGFSNYLQPYDEDHIIGIGRDAKETSPGRVQQLGVKVSMFDVTDFANPKETSSIIIGTSGTNSEALYNHKALLLDKEKGIMSIPIQSSARALEKNPPEYDDYSTVWNGFYVYGFENFKIVEKGKIAHMTGKQQYSGVYMSPRSLYIGDTLYTVMDGSIKMNDLGNISNEINSIKIGSTGEIIKYLEKEPVN